MPACPVEGELSGSSVLRAFKGSDFTGGSREGFRENIHQLSRCVLSGSWSPLTDQHQGSGSLVSAAGPDVGHGLSGLAFLLFSAWS